MPTAYIDAANLQFPDRCAACGGPAEAVHQIDASRGIDLLFIAVWDFFPIRVPVCGHCKRKRRARGIAYYVGSAVFIVVAGFASFLLILAEWKVAGVVVFGMVAAVSLAGRFKGDDFLEWTTLGLVVDVLRGRGTPLRLRFRDPDYFVAWRLVNPDAVPSREQLRIADAPAYADADTAAPLSSVRAPHITRATPAVCLAVSTVLLALHHGWVAAQGEVRMFVVLLLSMFGGLAAGGTLYPPLFHAVGRYGTQLPLPIRLLGGAFATAGALLGYYLLVAVYRISG